jgi:hypothetical protein
MQLQIYYYHSLALHLPCGHVTDKRMACLLAPGSEGQPVEIKHLSYTSINHCCIQEPCRVNLVESRMILSVG